MNQILNLTLASIGMALLLVPFFLAFSLLFTTRLGRAQEIMTRIPGRCFGIGAVNFAFMVIFSLALFSLSERVEGVVKGVLILAAAAVGVILSIALSLGLTGMVNLVGERLAPTQNRWRQTAWGALLLGFGSAVPLVGWFLLLPYIVWVGMGGVILGWMQRKA